MDNNDYNPFDLIAIFNTILGVEQYNFKSISKGATDQNGSTNKPHRRKT